MRLTSFPSARQTTAIIFRSSARHPSAKAKNPLSEFVWRRRVTLTRLVPRCDRAACSVQRRRESRRRYLVNETFARKYSAGPAAHWTGDCNSESEETHEIIGVVADVKNDDFDELVDLTSYLPYSKTRGER